MDKETYHYEYLQSEHWQKTRLKRLEEDNYRCVICGSEKNLCVHHLSYKNLGNEWIGELMTLCEKHHTNWHKQDCKKNKKTKEQILQELLYDRLFEENDDIKKRLCDYIYADCLKVGTIMREIIGDSKLKINGMRFSTIIRKYFSIPKISTHYFTRYFSMCEIGGLDCQFERVLRGKKKNGGPNTLEEIKSIIPQYIL